MTTNIQLNSKNFIDSDFILDIDSVFAVSFDEYRDIVWFFNHHYPNKQFNLVVEGGIHDIEIFADEVSHPGTRAYSTVSTHAEMYVKYYEDDFEERDPENGLRHYRITTHEWRIHEWYMDVHPVQVDEDYVEYDVDDVFYLTYEDEWMSAKDYYESWDRSDKWSNEYYERLEASMFDQALIRD